MCFEIKMVCAGRGLQLLQSLCTAPSLTASKGRHGCRPGGVAVLTFPHLRTDQSLRGCGGQAVECQVLRW